MFQSLPGVQKPVGLQETFRSLFKLEKIHIGTAHIVVDSSVELLEAVAQMADRIIRISDGRICGAGGDHIQEGRDHA